MNPARLTKRKEIAPEPPHILAVGRLVNYIPRFSRFSEINKGGVLDIIKQEKSCVYGIIYGIKKEYLYLIDRVEGAPYIYRQIMVDVRIEKSLNESFGNSEFSKKEHLKCYCYEVIEKSLLEIPPSRAYIEHVRIGHDKYGINIESIENIISQIGYYEDNR